MGLRTSARTGRGARRMAVCILQIADNTVARGPGWLVAWIAELYVVQRSRNSVEGIEPERPGRTAFFAETWGEKVVRRKGRKRDDSVADFVRPSKHDT